MSGQKVGYIRVSSFSQKTDRQLDGQILDKIFEDKLSGKNLDRPALQEMIAYVRGGDVVLVHSMDRLGRSLDDLKKIINQLLAKKVVVRFVKENIEVGNEKNPMSDLMIHIFAAFAEFERSIIRDRQREGIEIAKKKGIYKGRKHILSKHQVTELQKKYLEGQGVKSLCDAYSLSRPTVYRYLKDAPKLRKKIYTEENLKKISL